MNQSKKNLVSAVAWSTSGKVINTFLKFFSTPLLLAQYGKSDYGLIGLAMSINIYLQIMELGINTGNIRYISHWIAERKEDKIIKLVQSSLIFFGIIGIFNVFLLIILSFFCQRIFNLNIEQTIIFKNLLYILAFSSFFSWFFSITSQLIRAYERIDFEEKLNLINNVLLFGAVLLTIGFNLSITQYFILYGLLVIILFPIRVYKCKKLNANISFRPKWHKKIFNEVFRYSIGIFSMSIFQFSAANLRPVILGIQSGVTDVTDYKVIEQIVGIILTFSGSFLGILLPYVTRLKATGNLEAQKVVAFTATKYLTIILTLMAFGLIVIATPLIKLYVGTEYLYLTFWVGFWAITLLGSHNSAISALILADSNIRPITYFTIFSSISTITLSWFITPYYKIGGVLISYMIYVILQLSFYYIYYIPKVMHLDSLKILSASVLKPISVGVLSFLLSSLIQSVLVFDKPIYEILVFGGIFTFIYSILILLFIIKKSELKQLGI